MGFNFDVAGEQGADTNRGGGLGN
ncbi:hypothetical protein CBM2625_A120044 [Cupriavidus taiwanensis]|uniref:Uncharacterized protein n=1 Tax=Cupriavidus taiwanensis TaxID=164546 RepID=A0A375DX97_9BURK|nr:hypothetical protein CBM2613_A160045 [Cupriavidus taiwanensis]SPA04320.1 hypothetical protein CBM2625_A120044 [Cupriavidus taiwanensis]